MESDEEQVQRKEKFERLSRIWNQRAITEVVKSDNDLDGVSVNDEDLEPDDSELFIDAQEELSEGTTSAKLRKNSNKSDISDYNDFDVTNIKNIDNSEDQNKDVNRQLSSTNNESDQEEASQEKVDKDFIQDSETEENKDLVECLNDDVKLEFDSDCDENNSELVNACMHEANAEQELIDEELVEDITIVEETQVNEESDQDLDTEIPSDTMGIDETGNTHKTGEDQDGNGQDATETNEEAPFIISRSTRRTLEQEESPNEDGEQENNENESVDNVEEENLGIYEKESTFTLRSQRVDIESDQERNDERTATESIGAIRYMVGISPRSLYHEDETSSDDDDQDYRENRHVDHVETENLYNFTFNDVLKDLQDMSIKTDANVYNEEESANEDFNQDTPIEEQEMPILINNRALLKNAYTYELETFERNTMIIFNQENVDGYEPRLGTEQDGKALTRTFEKFGFEVKEHKDLCKNDLFKELKKFSEQDFTNYGCVSVAVLTHGSNMGSLRAKDRRYYESDIIHFFKTSGNPTLVTKPIVIIIQACRGKRTTKAVSVHRASKIRVDHEQDGPETYTLPVESDVLVLHSTYAGNASHRDEIKGSWFIQVLCDRIEALSPKHDLESILTVVKKCVAIDKSHEKYNEHTRDFDLNKQMPVMTSTLIRKLYLRKFGDQDNLSAYKDLVMIDDDKASDLAVEDGEKVNCACVLDRFIYLKRCVKYFVDENPEDDVALAFLDLADTFQDGVDFDASKEKFCKAISKHLMANATHCSYYKYLYFYDK